MILSKNLHYLKILTKYAKLMEKSQLTMLSILKFSACFLDRNFGKTLGRMFFKSTGEEGMSIFKNIYILVALLRSSAQ